MFLNSFFLPSFRQLRVYQVIRLQPCGQLELQLPSNLKNSADTTLKAIKGIGPAKLTTIRAACSDAINKTSEFVDRVSR